MDGQPGFCATGPGITPPDEPPGTGFSSPDLDNPYYNDPSTDPDQRFGLFQTTPGGAGGGEKVSQLRLVVKKDCLDLNGRFINYSLVNIITGNMPNGSYAVTEHLDDGRPPTSDGPNLFNDTQGAPIMAGQIWNTKQSFTISGPGVSGNPSIPVRMNGQDFGTLGIFRKANGNFQNPTILINGQAAPTFMPIGKLCDNDHMTEGH